MQHQHLPRSRPCSSVWAHYNEGSLVGMGRRPQLEEAGEPLSCPQAPERPL